jgi:hypothetical protein
MELDSAGGDAWVLKVNDRRMYFSSRAEATEVCNLISQRDTEIKQLRDELAKCRQLLRGAVTICRPDADENNWQPWLLTQLWFEQAAKATEDLSDGEKNVSID